MHNSLITYLSEKYNLPDTDVELIVENFTELEIPRKTSFLHVGDLQKKIGFVVHGYFRYYYLDKIGNEYTKYFAVENDFIFSMSSFIENTPAEFEIESITDAKILYTTTCFIKEQISTNPLWKEIYLKLIEKYYLVKEKREAELLQYDATQRYELFTERYPELNSILKRNQIASFLGITPETLSRIQKNCKILD